MDLKKYISEISDFPKKGINFKDISPILANHKTLDFIINSFEEQLLSHPNLPFSQKEGKYKVDKIVGLDARGFIFGSILAYKMKLPFIMLRKSGKLPGVCEKISYDLEYGSNTFEIQKKSIKSGDRIAIVDDLLATGGSAKAAIDLVEKLGGIVESLNFVVEIEFLKGKKLFGDKKVVSLVKY